MSTSAIYYVGVDVAQDFLALCGAPTASVENTPKALRSWLRQLKTKHPTAHLVCEATGRHHHYLQGTAATAAVPLSVVNPRQMRDFARSVGRLEKTDQVDARVIQYYGQVLSPDPTPLLPTILRELQDLLVVRQALVEEHTAWQHRDNLLCPAAHRLCQRRLRVIDTEVGKVEAQVTALLDRPEATNLQDRVQTMCLVCGVGPRTAWVLAAWLCELGQCNHRQIAKLSGLAPMNCDSGRFRGERHIAHGRTPVRRALYLAAVVAAQHNEALKPYYQRLRAAGKPAKVAYIAVARKLVVFLNRILTEAPVMTN